MENRDWGHDPSDDPHNQPGETPIDDPATQDIDPPEPDFFIGAHPTSCGAPEQELTPVDCTEHGDLNAQCVFSNHCFCSADAGFRCDDGEAFIAGVFEECAPGVTCISVE